MLLAHSAVYKKGVGSTARFNGWKGNLKELLLFTPLLLVCDYKSMTVTASY